MTPETQLESNIIDGLFGKLVTADVFKHTSPSEVTKEFMEEQKTINHNVLSLVTKIDKDLALMAKDVEAIHAQTKRTNGRVTNLEGTRVEYGEMWETQKNDQEFFHGKRRDLIWKIGLGALLLIIGVEKITNLIN